MFGGHEASLQVDRVAVRVLARVSEGRHTLGSPFLQLIGGNIAENEVTAVFIDPNGSLDETKSSPEFLNFSIGWNNLAERSFVANIEIGCADSCDPYSQNDGVENN